MLLSLLCMYCCEMIPKLKTSRDHTQGFYTTGIQKGHSTEGPLQSDVWRTHFWGGFLAHRSGAWSGRPEAEFVPRMAAPVWQSQASQTLHNGPGFPGGASGKKIQLPMLEIN